MADRADVSISLTSDEALVLFDLLHRWEDDDRVSALRHPSEQVALWNLSALLERELPEPIEPRYADLLAQARSRLSPSD